MDRIKNTQQLVKELYIDYAAALGIKATTIDFQDVKSIEKVFQSIYVGSSKATLNHTPYPHNLSVKLREAFADLLLLMDGVDLNIIKNNLDPDDLSTK